MCFLTQKAALKAKWLLSAVLIIFCLPVQGLAGESTYERISWGNRGGDTFYCIDIMSPDLSEIWIQAVACGENLYSWSAKEYIEVTLGLSQGLPDGFEFGWKVWSQGGYGGDGFQGLVVVGGIPCQGLSYLSTPEILQWGCRGGDTFYCIDILDGNGQMAHQAAACGEGIHSFHPNSLGLAPGTWNWKIWSSGGYGGEGFEGSFSLGAAGNSSYSANYHGTYWGDSSGIWNFYVDDNGVINGSGKDDSEYTSFAVSGSVSGDGAVSLGRTDDGGTFTGMIDENGRITGSWQEEGGYSGSFSGERSEPQEQPNGDSGDRLGDYSYSTGNDPQLQGDCTEILSMLGGGSVYGTSGDIKITRLTQREITLMIRGDGIGGDWVTLEGSVDGDRFNASMTINESEDGCTAHVTMGVTGTFSGSGFSGDINADIRFSCYGMAADCTIADNYRARR